MSFDNARTHKDCHTNPNLIDLIRCCNKNCSVCTTYAAIFLMIQIWLYFFFLIKKLKIKFGPLKNYCTCTMLGIGLVANCEDSFHESQSWLGPALLEVPNAMHERAPDGCLLPTRGIDVHDQATRWPTSWSLTFKATASANGWQMGHSNPPVIS